MIDTNGRRRFLKQAAASTAIGLSLPASSVLGANDRVRLGIIGPGSRGQELIKDALKVPNVELVAMADAFTLRLEQVKQLAPGAKGFNDHRRVLDMKDVDAILVATPLHCHARHFLDTIAAGKDLYCERR